MFYIKIYLVGTQLYTNKSLQTASGSSVAPSVIVQEPVIKLSDGTSGQVISVKEVDGAQVSQILSLSQNFSTGKKMFIFC